MSFDRNPVPEIAFAQPGRPLMDRAERARDAASHRHHHPQGEHLDQHEEKRHAGQKDERNQVRRIFREILGEAAQRRREADLGAKERLPNRPFSLLHL